MAGSSTGSIRGLRVQCLASYPKVRQLAQIRKPPPKFFACLMLSALALHYSAAEGGEDRRRIGITFSCQHESSALALHNSAAKGGEDRRRLGITFSCQHESSALALHYLCIK